MIFRRGRVYLVYEPGPKVAWTFDAATGTCSRPTTLEAAAVPAPREWRPVLASEPLPASLVSLLIHPYARPRK